jgi:hypothetical protein
MTRPAFLLGCGLVVLALAGALLGTGWPGAGRDGAGQRTVAVDVATQPTLSTSLPQTVENTPITDARGAQAVLAGDAVAMSMSSAGGLALVLMATVCFAFRLGKNATP